MSLLDRLLIEQSLTVLVFHNVERSWLGSWRAAGLVDSQNAELVFTSFFEINDLSFQLVAGHFSSLLPIGLISI